MYQITPQDKAALTKAVKVIERMTLDDDMYDALADAGLQPDTTLSQVRKMKQIVENISRAQKILGIEATAAYQYDPYWP